MFILAVTHGVTAHFFSDFGPSHIVTDADGEPARTLVIDEFTEDGVITVAAKRHGFDDGDEVMLEDIEGAAASGDNAAITDLNGLEGIKVKRIYYKYDAKRPDGKTEKREKQVCDLKLFSEYSGNTIDSILSNRERFCVLESTRNQQKFQFESVPGIFREHRAFTDLH